MTLKPRLPDTKHATPPLVRASAARYLLLLVATLAVACANVNDFQADATATAGAQTPPTPSPTASADDPAGPGARPASVPRPTPTSRPAATPRPVITPTQTLPSGNKRRCGHKPRPRTLVQRTRTSPFASAEEACFFRFCLHLSFLNDNGCFVWCFSVGGGMQASGKVVLGKRLAPNGCQPRFGITPPRPRKKAQPRRGKPELGEKAKVGRLNQIKAP